MFVVLCCLEAKRAEEFNSPALFYFLDPVFSSHLTDYKLVLFQVVFNPCILRFYS